MVAKGSKGSLDGTLTFVSTGTSDVSGTLQWEKPQQTKGDYPAQIDTILSAIGSYYIPPGKNGSVLPGFTSGALTLSDTGTLSVPASGPLVKNVMLSPPHTFTVTNPGTDKLKMTVTASNGVFKGTFVYPGDKKPTAFGGVLFQDQIDGGGFFLGPNGSGAVSLSP